MTDDFSIAGLRVVITGSTRGIGRAIAERFVNHGAPVVVTGRSVEQATKSPTKSAAPAGDSDWTLATATLFGSSP